MILLYHVCMSNARDFWNKEYKNPRYFNLSSTPSGDIEKFSRWLVREKRNDLISRYTFIIDAGCGNGRNLIYLSRAFGIKGLGFDISEVAIDQARKESLGMPLRFIVEDINNNIKADNESATIVLDLMSSHYLNEEGRKKFKQEVNRVLKPGGLFVFKSFLGDGDIRSKKLIEGNLKGKKLQKSKDKNSYVHPIIGAEEHIWSEKEVNDFFESDFNLIKFEKSYGHLKEGRANKRRYFVAYLEKKY